MMSRKRWFLALFLLLTLVGGVIVPWLQSQWRLQAIGHLQTVGGVISKRDYLSGKYFGCPTDVPAWIIPPMESLPRGLSPVVWNWCYPVLNRFGIDPLQREYVTIFVDKGEFTDETISAILQFPEVLQVQITARGFSDRHLARLAALPHLWKLEIPGADITDQGLKLFARKQNPASLIILGLRDTPITDTGIASLRSLTELRKIDLSNTRVTDGAVPELLCFEHLQAVTWSGTRVTTLGKTQFERIPRVSEATISSGFRGF